MTQVIASYKSQQISIDVMEIAHRFMHAYSMEEKEYSISYRLVLDASFMRDLEKRPLFLTPGGILLSDPMRPVYYEDAGGETIMDFKAVECRPFSINEYLEAINDRIAGLLPSVGLQVKDISKVDDTTYVTLDCGGMSAENYREYLIDLLNATIKQKDTVYGIHKIEEYVMETLRAICNERGNEVISISRESFARGDLFDATRIGGIDTQDESVYENSMIPDMEMDDIYLCRVYRGEDILKMILFKLYLERRIVDFDFDRSGGAKVKMCIEDTQAKPYQKEEVHRLQFNMKNGDIFLDSRLLGTLKPRTRSYEFFKVLYENMDSDVQNHVIIDHMKTGKMSKLPGDYLSDIKGRLPESIKNLIVPMNSAYMIDSTRFLRGI